MPQTLVTGNALNSGSSPWLRMTDRLAQAGWYVLLAAIAIGFLGGVLMAAVPAPADSAPQATEEQCPEPPCFDLDLSGLPPSAIPSLLSLLGSLLAILLGLPSLLAGVWALTQRRWADAGRYVLSFCGPLLVLVGTEIIPHVLLPCAILPWVCEALPGHGLNVTSQWHQLDHMLVGGLPMTLLYGWALRRWRRPPATHAPIDSNSRLTAHDSTTQQS